MIKFLTHISGSESPWALFSLVFFFCLFVGIVIWVVRKPAGDFQEVNRLPLLDGTEKEERIDD